MRYLFSIWVAATLLAAATQLAAARSDRQLTGEAQCRPGLATVAAPPAVDGRPAYVACLPVRSGPSAETRIDVPFGRAAASATGTDVVVVCWSKDDWSRIDAAAAASLGEHTHASGGFVWAGQRVANLPARICRILDAVVYGGRRPVNRWVAWAFKNLTHEAFHVTGVDDEAATECYALQRMSRTIRALGLGPRYAERLASISWSRYPRLRTLEPEYFSKQCRNDGSLDLDPRLSRWPGTS